MASAPFSRSGHSFRSDGLVRRCGAQERAFETLLHRLPSNKPMQQTALSFQKEDHCILKLASDINRSALLSWLVITPQLMGRAVREHRAFGVWI